MTPVKLACYCGYIDAAARWEEKEFSGEPLPWCPTGCGRMLYPTGGPNRHLVPLSMRLGEWWGRQIFKWRGAEKERP